MSARQHSASTIPVALVYPNSSRVGLSNLGFQYVHQVWNAHPLFSVERFFVEPAGSSDSKGRGCVSSEMGRGDLSRFPIIAFSLPFENDYPVVIRALLKSNIPCFSAQRDAQDPLVIAGGVSISVNPEPLASLFDVIFVGEVNESSDWKDFLDVLASVHRTKHTRKKWDRSELFEFSGVPGAYVPAAYRFHYQDQGNIDFIEASSGFSLPVGAVKRTGVCNQLPMALVQGKNAVFDKSILIEVNRGCGRGCRFCTSGWIHRPVRHRSLDEFCRQILGQDIAGKTIGLVGSDLAGHPQLTDILRFIIGNGGRFSLSSIRPEGLTLELIKLLSATGQKTVTLAPETASARMKKIIGKSIPDELFFEKIEWLVSNGIPNIRFYFMVGLPTERDDDIHSIVDFILKARTIFVAASRTRKKIGRISVQINPFVPKPWTPFQWVAMESPKSLEKKIRLVRNELERVPNVLVRAESVREAVVQGYVSRGDRRIAAILYEAISENVRLTTSLRQPSSNAPLYLYRDRDRDEIFPWDVVDHGVEKITLRRLFEKALSFENAT